MSVYLDLIRIGAAIVVVLHHTWPTVYPKSPFPFPGHHAVVVFFVLSGFVIAYVTDRKDHCLFDYAVNRLSRIWSVAAPALALGMVATLFVGAQHFADAAPAITDPVLVATSSVASLLFIAQSWTWDLVPPLNSPFWSLSYEAWYYALFGAWSYLEGRRRWAIMALMAFAAGPKILLLMPTWLLGVWLYRTHIGLSPRAAWFLFALSVAGYLILFQFDVGIMIRTRMDATLPSVMETLGGSRSFVGDYLLALLVTANFVAMSNLKGLLLLRWRRPVSAAASFTLSAYLYHMPVFVLLWVGLEWHHWSVYAPLLGTIVALGLVTEHKRLVFRRALLVMCRTGSTTNMQDPSAQVRRPDQIDRGHANPVRTSLGSAA